MRSYVLAAAFFAIALPPGGAAAESAPVDTVVVKRSGIAAHAEVAEEFAERCRVRTRVVNIDEEHARSLRTGLHSSDVVLAVGQRALDAVVGTRAHVISALTLSPPESVVVADAIPPPELTLRALKAARPSVKRIVIVHGPRTDALVSGMTQPARDLGLTLVFARAGDGAQAVRELHRIVATPPGVDAIWLAPDIDVLSSQLLQYAISLEIQRMLPVAAVSRQQVKAGALIAVDADPRAVGRQAADLANRMLAGESASSLGAHGLTGSLELSVNGEVARRLGVDLAALSALDARIE
jgi:hypothetical protein